MALLLAETPAQALAVALAALALFVLLLVVLRVSRARVFAHLSGPDAVLLLLLGAVVGRGVLGTSPTLGASVLALAVLLAARGAVGMVSRTARGRRLVLPPPLVLVAGGACVQEHLRLARVRPEDLASALRGAGVAGVAEVACAVLEPNGRISVTRLDPARPLARELFRDVRGIERVPDRYFADH